MILQLVIIIFLLVFLYILITRYKAPWMPILKNDLVRLDKLLVLEDGKTFYDLGCGDGRVIFYLARKYPRVNFVGVEISLIMLVICCLRKIFGRYRNVKIIFNDFLRLDLNKADYLYVFILRAGLRQLAEKINHECVKNLWVIASCFPIIGWEKYLIRKDKPGQNDVMLAVYQYQKEKG